jgi:predicted small lipoprotein YifL
LNVHSGRDNRGMKILMMIVIAVAALAACRQEGPAEKAGRQIDQTADKAARGVEKAGENVRDAVNGKK